MTLSIDMMAQQVERHSSTLRLGSLDRGKTLDLIRLIPVRQLNALLEMHIYPGKIYGKRFDTGAYLPMCVAEIPHEYIQQESVIDLIRRWEKPAREQRQEALDESAKYADAYAEDVVGEAVDRRFSDLRRGVAEPTRPALMDISKSDRDILTGNVDLSVGQAVAEAL